MKVQVKVFVQYIEIQLMVKIARFMSTLQSAWVAVCCRSGESKKGCWIKANPPCSFSRFCLSLNNLFCRREVLRGKREVHQELFSVGVTFIFEISVVIRMALK